MTYLVIELIMKKSNQMKMEKHTPQSKRAFLDHQSSYEVCKCALGA